MDPKQSYFDKRGQALVKALKDRNFEAHYCATRDEALEKALSLIPTGSVVGWGGATSAQQIGLLDVMRTGDYREIDRDKASDLEDRVQAMRQCLLADVFITGANAISMDGQMVNIDGNGNRVAAIVYGPKSVVVVAGMNKVVDTVEDAVVRARSVAAPMNKQRFPMPTPCMATGTCADCNSDGCICNQILITRRNNGEPGRIKFILVGEELGF